MPNYKRKGMINKFGWDNPQKQFKESSRQYAKSMDNPSKEDTIYSKYRFGNLRVELTQRMGDSITDYIQSVNQQFAAGKMTIKQYTAFKENMYHEIRQLGRNQMFMENIYERAGITSKILNSKEFKQHLKNHRGDTAELNRFKKNIEKLSQDPTKAKQFYYDYDELFKDVANFYREEFKPGGGSVTEEEYLDFMATIRKINELAATYV